MTTKDLITKRITLTKLETEDSLFILELLNTKGWIKFIGDRNIQNQEDALNYIKTIISNSNITYWVVALRENGDKIGIITLIKRDHFDFHDIGFAFLPQYEKKGYASEASSAVMNFITESTNFKAILASTIPENKSSIKLVEKLGFSYYKSVSTENKTLSVYKIDLEKVKIDKLTKDFFSAFTNRSKKPNLELLYQSCLDELIIVKNTTGLCETYDLESFITPRKELLTNGTLTEFEEYEVEEQTKITRNIAQRISHYQKEGILQGQKFTHRGTKMFQFVKKGNDWKICSVIWDDE